jgi:hypothetical protein
MRTWVDNPPYRLVHRRRGSRCQRNGYEEQVNGGFSLTDVISLKIPSSKE